MIISIYLFVLTLWSAFRCRTLLSLSVLCTFCPRCSCRRSRTLSESTRNSSSDECGVRGGLRIEQQPWTKRVNYCTTVKVRKTCDSQTIPLFSRWSRLIRTQMETCTKEIHNITFNELPLGLSSQESISIISSVSSTSSNYPRHRGQSQREAN